MAMKPASTFTVAYQCDTLIVIIDEDVGRSVTNDIYAVVLWLDRNLEGGIGPRSLYYLDTEGWFDEVVVVDGLFDGFKRCSQSQQGLLAKLSGEHIGKRITRNTF